MTKLLEKAFKVTSKLPEVEQNVIAHWLMDEIASEKKWEKAYANSENVLAQLANEALAEYENGKTKLMDITK